jgi:Type III restriction enzyme, res subunit/Type I restriction enzyme R protein N terminus (HSDR_N)
VSYTVARAPKFVTPEERARQTIDTLLEQAGWIVQSRRDANIDAGLGVAVREFPLGRGYGEADYLLFINAKAAGVIEAKKEGTTLVGVEIQTQKYSEGIPDAVPAFFRPLPFCYQSTGIETRFTNLLEPDASSRAVFSFHTPSTMARWLEDELAGSGSTPKARLRTMPNLIETGLRPAQVTAINALEDSMRHGRRRALIQMATGAGKTYTACNFLYRLIKFTVYEPADQLLQRILRERRARWEADTLAKMIASGKAPSDDRWKQKYKEPAALDFTNLPALPEGWCWTNIAQLAVVVRNGISVKPDEDSGLPILRISAVRPLEVDLTDVRYLEDTDEWRDYELDPGNLLFTRYNGNRDFVGVCGKVGLLSRRTVHPDKLIRVVLCSGDCLPGYIEIVSNSGFSRSFMERRIRTTAGQSGVSGEDVKNMPLPLCPTAEQERMTAEIDRQLTAVSSTMGQAVAGALRADRLRRTILDRAFSGRLVPQDPNDEPASVLLERIRAERASGGAHNGSRYEKNIEAAAMR